MGKEQRLNSSPLEDFTVSTCMMWSSPGCSSVTQRRRQYKGDWLSSLRRISDLIGYWRILPQRSVICTVFVDSLNNRETIGTKRFGTSAGPFRNGWGDCLAGYINHFGVGKEAILRFGKGVNADISEEYSKIRIKGAEFIAASCVNKVASSSYVSTRFPNDARYVIFSSLNHWFP